MKYAYKTKYNNPEHKKVKAAGAKWNRHLKLWMSNKPIEGLTPEQPSGEYLPYFSYDDQKKRAVVEQVKEGFIQIKKHPELVDKIDVLISKAKEYFKEDTFVNQCCLAAIEENKERILGGIING